MKMLMVASVTLIVLSGSVNLTAQTWKPIGSAGCSAGPAVYMSLALDSGNTPYVAYRDGGNGNKATVMKFNGASWDTVGSPGFSVGSVYRTPLALDSSNAPYVAYRHVGGSNKTTVMKFNGTSWDTVGSAWFSAGETDYTSLALDSSNMPYVAYQDIANAFRATVMKFNGASWEPVGSPGFSAGGAYYTSLALDSSNTPYLAYQDGVNDNKATVMKFNGASWEPVGSPGFSAGGAYYMSLALDSSNTPYLAYQDGVNDNKATVMKQAMASPSDFNGDGNTDIIWHNTGNNKNAIWLMNGGTMSSGDLSIVAFTNTDQVRCGKFDSDSNSDILVYSPTSANAVIHIMNGATAGENQEIAASIPPNQRLAGVGHFNRTSDSKSDILWHDVSSGANEVWLMDKFTILSQVALPAVDSNWELVGIGDFNGDGHSDILWRKNTGHNVIWLMDGTTVLPESGNIYTVTDFNWKIVAILDIDGDGKSDLFWRNQATGFNVIWLMDQLTIKSSGNTLVVPLEWQIAATGNFGAAGNILWRKQLAGSGFSIVWKQTSEGKPLSSQSLVPQELNITWSIVGNLTGQRITPVTPITRLRIRPVANR